MEFKQFKKLMQEHYATMGRLFTVDCDKEHLWELYLNSFEDKKIFRIRTEHDCSACRHFVKQYGSIVTIKNGETISLWDFDVTGSEYEPVVKALGDYVRSFDVNDVFVSDVARCGTDVNYQKTDKGVLTWDHLCIDVLPVIDCGTVRGRFRDQKNVFKRSLEEISTGAVEIVLELIASNSLYKGEEWKSALETFLQFQKDFYLSHNKDNFCWEQDPGPVVGKIRNHSIGTLLVDISNNVDLDAAVRKYEAIVAPSNYKRPKAIFTQKQVQEAEQTIMDLGFLDSLPRRYATIDDIKVNNVLFANRDVKKKKGIFEELQPARSFNKVEELSIDKFLDILPGLNSIELFLENKHEGNLVSLIAPRNDAPSMFKWGNNFSWAYKGNMTDSMKERVKSFGGNVEGKLRFSIQWNDQGDNHDDLDAHCIEPDGFEIYYFNKSSKTGVLDVDIIRPDGVAVENIIWNDKMPKGTYKLFVHCYSSRYAKSGFSAEVEFDGQVYSFNYSQPLYQGQRVDVAEVTLSDRFTIKEMIPSQLSSKTMWNLNTQQFHPVSIMLLSPNYWDTCTGNKHYFFMLQSCTNPNNPSGFFNEYLISDLLPHKRVLEALSGKMRVEDCPEQLSGVGFSSTQRNSVVLKVTGTVDRMLKVLI